MDLVYANCNTYVGAPNGSIQQLVLGEPWDANDPLVKARPELFSTQPTKLRRSYRDLVGSEIEQATAAPGEKRNR